MARSTQTFGARAVIKRRFVLKYVAVAAVLVLALLFGVTSSPAQQSSVQTDGWRGLVIDVSTPQDAIRILGQPASDKSGQTLRLVLVDKWLPGGSYNEKIFRTLMFKKPDGFEQVWLSFRDDKLVFIDLVPHTGNVQDWIDPDNLAEMFNSKFIYSEWHFGKKLAPLTEFEKLDSTPPKKFAMLYDMIAITDRTFVLAYVDNKKSFGTSLIGPPCTGCANAENKKKKARDAGGTFPGQVSGISIISRKLGSEPTNTSSP